MYEQSWNNTVTSQPTALGDTPSSEPPPDLHDSCKYKVAIRSENDFDLCGVKTKLNKWMYCWPCSLKVQAKRKEEEAKKNGGGDANKPTYSRPSYNNPTETVKSVPPDKISDDFERYKACFKLVANSDEFKDFPLELKKDIATTLFIQGSR